MKYSKSRSKKKSRSRGKRRVRGKKHSKRGGDESLWWWPGSIWYQFEQYVRQGLANNSLDIYGLDKILDDLEDMNDNTLSRATRSNYKKWAQAIIKEEGKKYGVDFYF